MFEKLIASFLAVCELVSPFPLADTQEMTHLEFLGSTIFVNEAEYTEADSIVSFDELSSELHIKTPGTYVLDGNFDGSIIVDLKEYAAENGYQDAKDCPDAVVRLLLDSVTINGGEKPAIMFRNVYECDAERKASGIKDLSMAGAGVILSDCSVNSISGAYGDDKNGRTAAIVSDVSMQLGAKDDKAKLYLMSGMNGVSALGNLTVSGGDYELFTENDGITADMDDCATIALHDGKISIYTDDGDGIRSDGYAILNNSDVFVTAGGKTSYGLQADAGAVVNSGNIAISAANNVHLDNGDQPVITIESEQGLQNVAVTNKSGKLISLFDLTQDEKYTGLGINRTFTSLILSQDGYTVGDAYTVIADAVIDEAASFEHGRLLDPTKYSVVDGYPMKFKTASIGTGATYASSYLSSVYNMATILERTNQFLDIGRLSDIDTHKLDEAIDTAVQLDEAATLEEAAKNAEAAIINVNKNSLAGNALWTAMNNSLQAANTQSSAEFVLWDKSTIFSGAFAQSMPLKSFNALDTPTSIIRHAYATENQSAQDLPAMSYLYDMPARFTYQNFATLDAVNRTLFYDGYNASSFYNDNGVLVSGDTIRSATANQNAIRLTNNSQGSITNVSIGKTGDADKEASGSNAALFMSNSEIQMTQSDVFSKAKFSEAAFITDNSVLEVANVTIWTNGDDSKTLRTSAGTTVSGKNLVISSTGKNSTPIYTDGNIDIFSADLNSAGENSPLINTAGEITLRDVNGMAQKSPIAVVSNYLQLDKCDLSAFHQPADNTYPCAFLLKRGNDNPSVLIRNSVLRNKNDNGTMFFVDETNADIVLENTSLVGQSQLLMTDNGQVKLHTKEQLLSGDIVTHEDGIVIVELTDNSSFFGMTKGNVTVKLDNSSFWKLTGSCSVYELDCQNDYRNILDTSGRLVTIKDASGNILQAGESEHTLTIMN